MSIDKEIGKILGKLESIDEKLDTHLEDYKETKDLVNKIEKRQIGAIALVAGACSAAGTSIGALIGKFMT